MLEILCAALLFAGAWRRSAALGLGALNVLFIALFVQAMARGLDVECGCFGKWDPAGAHPMLGILRDMILLGASIVCWRHRTNLPEQ